MLPEIAPDSDTGNVTADWTAVSLAVRRRRNGNLVLYFALGISD